MELRNNVIEQCKCNKSNIGKKKFLSGFLCLSKCNEWMRKKCGKDIKTSVIIMGRHGTSPAFLNGTTNTLLSISLCISLPPVHFPKGSTLGYSQLWKYFNSYKENVPLWRAYMNRQLLRKSRHSFCISFKSSSVCAACLCILFLQNKSKICKSLKICHPCSYLNQSFSLLENHVFSYNLYYVKKPKWTTSTLMLVPICSSTSTGALS